jgi:hypothetical protein
LKDFSQQVDKSVIGSMIKALIRNKVGSKAGVKGQGELFQIDEFEIDESLTQMTPSRQ